MSSREAWIIEIRETYIRWGDKVVVLSRILFKEGLLAEL